MEITLSITYQLTRKDIIYANLVALFQQPILLAFFALAFLFITYQNWIAISPEYSFIVNLVIFLIFEFIPVIFITGVLFFFVFLTTLSRKNKTLLAKQTLTLTDEMLIFESEYSKSELKWTVLQRLIRKTNHVFLYVSAMGIVLIPKHAFVSNDDWEKFIQICITKMQKDN